MLNIYTKELESILEEDRVINSMVIQCMQFLAKSQDKEFIFIPDKNNENQEQELIFTEKGVAYIAYHLMLLSNLETIKQKIKDIYEDGESPIDAETCVLRLSNLYFSLMMEVSRMTIQKIQGGNTQHYLSLMFKIFSEDQVNNVEFIIDIYFIPLKEFKQQKTIYEEKFEKENPLKLKDAIKIKTFQITKDPSILRFLKSIKIRVFNEMVNYHGTWVYENVPKQLINKNYKEKCFKRQLLTKYGMSMMALDLISLSNSDIYESLLKNYKEENKNFEPIKKESFNSLIHMLIETLLIELTIMTILHDNKTYYYIIDFETFKKIEKEVIFIKE